VFFAHREFAARHHMTASDAETLSLAELLAMASPEDREAFESLSLGYTETSGAPDLRERIAATCDTLGARDVLCLAGAGEGLYAAARVLLEADDHVVVPLPNYQSAESVPASIARVTGVPMDYVGAGRGRGGWRLDVDAILSRVRGLIAENLERLDALFAEFPALFEWARPAGGCTAFLRYLGDDGVETFCRRLLEDSGVLLLPASIYASALGRVPFDHFRIGFGRGQTFRGGMQALRQHLERNNRGVANCALRAG